MNRLSITVYIALMLLGVMFFLSKLSDRLDKATLGHAAHLYLSDWQQGRENTRRKRIADVTEFVQFASTRTGNAPALLDLTPGHIEEYISALHKRGLKPATVGAKLNSIKAFTKATRDRLELVGVTWIDPAKRLSPPKLSTKGWQGLTQLELSTLWEILEQKDTWKTEHDNYRNRALLRCYFAGGYRCAELVALTEGQLSPDFSYAYDVRGKGGRYDDIALSPTATAWLQDYRGIRGSELAKRDGIYARQPQRAYPVFVSWWYSKPGDASTYFLSDYSARRIAKQALIKAGVSPDRAHTHTLRHAHGKALCESSGPRMAAESLRHSNLQHVMRYTNPTSAEIEQAKRNL
jgi:site-specific recombinase XerD